MAWSFGGHRWIKKGKLDNHIPGRTSGSMVFASLGEVKFFLRGDLIGKLKGKIVKFINPDYDEHFIFDNGQHKLIAQQYFERFGQRQQGVVGGIIVHNHFYLDWVSEVNGRCVLEIPRAKCRVFDAPEPRYR